MYNNLFLIETYPNNFNLFFIILNLDCVNDRAFNVFLRSNDFKVEPYSLKFQGYLYN